ncbi:GNAT family N-acetyltransferase [Vibrio methylphosphonaticus]|uniref:GNAT family N-acetyltransferase n=1 Tax=Vibrio methylphosphonaticus TaxID=2946866 RepID=UPI002029E644|nr:GNAT family N-acetyltransferase [Vibrio methylphosphonaticus]MCL9777377.1 GNAT family N-acetyltransferase [Vibrio methylphosphonaticus]
MIREATPEDCTNLAVLAIKVWLDTYAANGIRKEYADYVLNTFTEGYFLNRLTLPNYRVLVSVCDGVLEGFIMVNLASRFESEDYGYEIEKLYIHAPFSGKGLGRALLNDVAQRYGERFWLYTWVENTSNGFYQHLGFTQVGQISFDFYGVLVENHVYFANKPISQ